MSPPDSSEALRPFALLDYFDANGSAMGNGFDMRPHSGIATIAWILEGRGGFLGRRGHFVSTVGLDKGVSEHTSGIKHRKRSQTLL
jgi:Pirin